MEEMMDVIDENDNIIDAVTRKEIREKKLLHRGITVLIFNSKNEIFVHKRTKTKNIYPGMYDMTCGGGVLSGENYDEAAKRELKEEVGIENIKLRFLFKIRYKSDLNNVLSKVYSCVYDRKIKIQKEEIEEGYFLTIKELKKLMKEKEFCPDALVTFKNMKKCKELIK